jgi:hypothetical protein
MKFLSRLAILVASAYMPTSAAALGLVTTGCGCAECCQCDFSCSGPGATSTGSSEIHSDACLDCEDACLEAANQASRVACEPSDVKASECG